MSRLFSLATEMYAQHGVDVQRALDTLAQISISLHCWQGDDVGGFESQAHELGGGLAVTGRYPGRARNAPELRSDLEMALKLIPGRHRLNLHASYGEFAGQTVDRDAIAPEHFMGGSTGLKNVAWDWISNPPILRINSRPMALT